MSGLIIAVPSKGRLEADTRRIFVEAGLTIDRPGGARSYQGDIDALPDIAVRFLPASEIARDLIRGKAHIGVTGVDLIHEASEQGPDAVDFVKPLGFGNADVVVAVPDAWIDVVSMRDLADVASDFRAGHKRWLRVATKYLNLTRRYFVKFGIAEYRIVESLGATEAAPAVGVADLIVDITSTGSTLSANGLRVIEDGLILRSEANLIVSRTAEWTPEASALRDRLLEAFGVGGG
jgi:ATP phosphoribosyltransferase